MHLSGQKILEAERIAIWKCLMNPVTLTRIIPGITKLERTADNSYKSVVEIKIGPVSGSFEGTVVLDDIVEHDSFVLRARQNSKIGDANASVNIRLSPAGVSAAELTFEGDVKLTGLLARMGQRMVSGVANTLVKQFFSNLEKELHKESAA
jgi:uncharacterized protein